MSGKLHVCIVAWNFPVRSETFVREHALGLARRGHLVTVVSRGPGEGISDGEIAEVEAAGISLRNGGGLQRGWLAKACHLAGLLVIQPSRIQWLWTRSFPERYLATFTEAVLKTARPDVLHVHFGTHAEALHRLEIDCPVVVTWHGHDANVVPRIREENCYRELFRATWLHTVGSGFMRERLLRLGANEGQLSLIPMGIDLTRFSWRDRRVQNEEQEPVRLVAVGRLDEMKGHRFLIAAVADFLREGRNVMLRIVGEGPLRKHLEAQIAETGFAEKIVLCGSRSSAEVVEELHEADVFCLTGVPAENGRVETQGVVLAEAQATGLPVIASSVGGIPDSMIDGETGVLCEPGDVEGIRNAIRFFLDDPDRRKKFGRRGRAFVKERFSLETMNERFEALYRDLLGRQPSDESISVVTK